MAQPLPRQSTQFFGALGDVDGELDGDRLAPRLCEDPRFANSNVPVWYDRDKRFSIEGGDELVLSSEVMVIGISERTTSEAIEMMATKLFAGSNFRKVIAMEIPKSHAFMHLDTVFTMIDYDKFTIHPEIRDRS